MTVKLWWWLSFLVSLLFAGLIGLQWYLEDAAYEPNHCQLIDEPSARNDVKKKIKRNEISKK